MPAGYIIAERIQPGSQVEGFAFTLTRIEQYTVDDASNDQLAAWTMNHFEFPEDQSESVANVLADVLDAHLGTDPERLNKATAEWQLRQTTAVGEYGSLLGRFGALRTDSSRRWAWPGSFEYSPAGLAAVCGGQNPGRAGEAGDDAEPAPVQVRV
jgi:hypothetical protein